MIASKLWLGSITAFALAVSAPAAWAAQQDTPPDLTQGGSIPEGWTHDWNLGATGARGWMASDRMVTTGARQIAITEVAPGSPAAGVLAVGDVILGVGGQPFTFDPRTELGRALTAAESEAGGGGLTLTRWRAGETEEVVLELPVLGSYSATAPYDCPKSRRILEQGCAALARRVRDPSYRENPITRSLNALALLASGNREYIPLLIEEASWASEYSADSFQTWYYGYVLMFLAEYVMVSGDDSVVPGLERLALEAAHGQSKVGSWGHRFAMPDGRLAGYGMMNSPGVPLTIGLVLARDAGVDDPAVSLAIERSARLLRFYIGKGAIPYGDHHPWIETHEDNGKCGMAAVLFDLLGEAEGAEFFSRMSVASHGAERDTGHTGNFFNILWALPGVARSGPQATGAWMEEFGAWYLDLARRWDGSFRHQGPPEPTPDSYDGWDSSGACLLAYALPLRKLRLTGRRSAVVPPLGLEAARSLLADGRGWDNKDRNSTYDGLETDELLGRLGSWSPTVRERAAMALGRRGEDVTERLVDLLEASDLYARYGACRALKLQRGRAGAAIPALLDAMDADDLWLRVLAAEALAGVGEPARGAVPKMLVRLTESDPVGDPRGMEQRYMCFSLFDRREGLIGRSLEGVDRELLMEGVRAGLQNEDGRARGCIGSVYANLTFEEIEPLLPDIRRAIVEPAPSGIMFAHEIRMAGLELFTRYRISEGIELLADYARNQKQHASEHRIVEVLEMLEQYGAHAQRVIPRLEATASFFENEEQDFPRHLSLGKAQRVREAIATIQASTDAPELIHLER